MTDYALATKMFVPDSYVFKDALIDTKSHYAIVVHKTGDRGIAPLASQLARYFCGPDNRIEMKSVHYIVDKFGSVVQCVRETDGAGGNGILENGYDPFWDCAPVKGNMNLCTFSIEHCSGTQNGDNSDSMTELQKEESFKLIAYLCHKYSISINNIKGHNTLCPDNRKDCPGNYPWDELFNYLKGENKLVPAGWNDNGKELTAPNKVKVVKGFRSYILDNEWRSDNVPLEEEHGSQPVLESNYKIGNGTRQIFMNSLLTWTRLEGVHESPVGKELNYVLDDRNNCRKIIDQLHEQITSLRNGMPMADISELRTNLQKVISYFDTIVR